MMGELVPVKPEVGMFGRRGSNARRCGLQPIGVTPIAATGRAGSRDYLSPTPAGE
jgi:hypothetical protein